MMYGAMPFATIGFIVRNNVMFVTVILTWVIDWWRQKPSNDLLMKRCESYCSSLVILDDEYLNSTIQRDRYTIFL